jgi:hypothetical protein
MARLPRPWCRGRWLRRVTPIPKWHTTCFVWSLRSLSWVFPNATGAAGYDTGMHVRNTGRGGGRCAVHYNGVIIGTKPYSQMEMTDREIGPGQEVQLRLNMGGNLRLRGSPSFKGCVVIQCNFKRAEGSMLLYDRPDRHAPPQPAVVLAPGQEPGSVDPRCGFVSRR